MNKVFWREQIGKTIDKYALILTFIAIGIFLQFNPEFILSKDITAVIRAGCFGVASVFFIIIGAKLERQGIFGIPEIALGAIQMYILANALPRDGYQSIIFLLSIAWFLFNFIGGALAFVYCITQKYREEKLDLFAKIESIVATITALLTTFFAGIQIFVQ